MKAALLAAVLALPSLFVPLSAEDGRLDPKYPFRTEWANANLPWYQPKPLEFPPHHSDRRIGGELIATDYIHRTGRFRTNQGELIDFTMPPYGSVYYLNAEADLRDVPLGTFFLFFLNQDEQGGFTRLATMQDEFTMMANHGYAYRIDDVKLADGRLKVTKVKLSENKDENRNELLVNARTRVWKGERQVKLSDLVVGDPLLVSLGANATKGPGPRWCTDLWIGADTHKAVSEKQRKQHNAFIKQRGVPAWIDRVDGRKLTVTFFSNEPASLRGLFADEGIDPEKWAKDKHGVTLVVANEHLRSYWPQVCRKGGRVLEYTRVPTECYGSSGIRWIIEADTMLEGFRQGRILRIFPHHTWPVEEMPFGEGLHAGGHDFEEPPECREEEPADYSYRTDFGNAHLPWYQPQPGVFPPPWSAHQVVGELLHVDANQRAGRFREERSGQTIAFTLLPSGVARFLGAESDLGDVPLGTRCRFLLHPDAQGTFIKASVVLDEFTWLNDHTITYRLEQARLDEHRLFVARDAAAVPVDYQLEPRKPPYLGRTELLVDDQTRVWKGNQRATLAELANDDVLLVNLAGGTTTTAPRCSDIWIGTATHQQVIARQRDQYVTRIKQRGAPAWVERIDDRKVTIAFVAGDRKDFISVLNGEPWGKGMVVTLADEAFRPQGEPFKVRFANNLQEVDTYGAYGAIDRRWVIETATAEGYAKGQALRVFKEEWLAPAAK